MLNGIRIIEIEGIGPGPFAGMTLADLGAEVIVVQRKGGAGEVGGGRPPLTRGKRAIALDLKDAADLVLLKQLIASADGLIEGFRPGVMERLGLGPEDCQAIQPRLVYGRMTGWGQDGPMSQQAGHDLNYISVAGALWYASPAGQPPLTPPTLVGDIGGGALYLVIGLLAGIMEARQTGKGRVVDAAIVDGAAHMMNLLLSLGATGNLSYDRGQSRLDGPHYSRTYVCADGGFISVQCLEPKFYAAFREILGLDQDRDFDDQADRARWPEQTAKLATIFAAKPRDHWAGVFAGSDACVAPILTPEEAAAHPHMQARGTYQPSLGGLQAVAAPRFTGYDPTPRPVASYNQHEAEIRAELAAKT
ncbi:CaiB/BaiF CoA-transferase family protein [Pseudooceanicola sp.]|uniref:CaiB/BaiF CoA transferase family protein n=1 Tax=Pseudooceanicola sp. TaxID=1914328 RepID=UPI002638BEA1|nr:CaiB/BaiF CoA-transferase family protein [Pseudooceanicola sp.]MDF1854581.1 CaiB/BaiF CoA-transferase family protein [Pseudooceanicola sp.]